VKQWLCGVSSCVGPLTRGEIFRGLRLCASCRKLLATHLVSLPQMYQACEDELEVHRQHPIRVVGNRRPAGICLNEETVAVRDNVVGVLVSWRDMIAEERGVIGPKGRDVRKLASFVETYLDWLATHVVAADFVEEITGLVRSVKRVLNPAQARTIDLVPCPREGCGQMVRASISTAQRRLPPQVSCGAGHTWQPGEWLDLSRQLDPMNCDALT
jgi:hypothetical protein